MKILNIDEILSEKIKLIIGSKEILLDSQLTLKQSIALMKLAEVSNEMANNNFTAFEDAIKLMHSDVIGKDNISYDEFTSNMNMPRLTSMINFLSGLNEEDKKKESQS